jgi:hypothetical protein
MVMLIELAGHARRELGSWDYVCKQQLWANLLAAACVPKTSLYREQKLP